ncbi:DUF4241 domain-containing protein [Segniliparus rugosus]|uniref:DUF4241 domain-containing protein n=1 Tax=Segniliparus rugosus (strain ATCC BAA-974 / DSM 45345 / CCUG 50838 / CIP 108380 / JCM 13579 / CDC 945) TaxID=679197 RepID=E5XNS1_SEGRC|nr:DUF4241 domain-containing protein [Segniliparus rugosus]EFV14010.2 hypothetical protein HMPREF9336_01142 [Segniliparus rugosus ATCC BAA-974]
MSAAKLAWAFGLAAALGCDLALAPPPAARADPYLPDLDRLTTDGSTYRDTYGEYVIEERDAGFERIPTGRITALDPIVYAEADPEPFTAAIAPGDYQVKAFVAQLSRDCAPTERRVAALQLVVSDEPAASWQPALRPGQDGSDLGEDQYYGYPSDAATGAIADVAAVAALSGWDEARFEKAFLSPSSAHWFRDPIPGLLNVVADPASGANLVTVTTGFGDGSYPTFVGRSAQGQITSFVTDFLVVPKSDEPARCPKAR